MRTSTTGSSPTHVSAEGACLQAHTHSHTPLEVWTAAGWDLRDWCLKDQSCTEVTDGMGGVEVLASWGVIIIIIIFFA